MKIYISGPITNNPNYKEDFARAEKELVKLGYDFFNPALIELGEDATWGDYMKYDIKELLKCDGIFMLKGWKLSKGARLELFIAKKLKLAVI